MWLIPSLVASVAAVGLEYIYRARWFDSYWQGIWLILPAGIVIQTMLFYSYRDAPKLLVAWSMFFAVNAGARFLISTVALHEAPTPWTILALALIVAGSFLIRW